MIPPDNYKRLFLAFSGLMTIWTILLPASRLYGFDDTAKFLSENKPTIILPRKPGNLSPDPVEGEHPWNAWLMHFIYAKIIRVDTNNNLMSDVLEDFKYQADKKEITLKIKKNLNFQNGKNIVIDDIILSILRTALKCPLHPLTSQITGVRQWSVRKEPLKSLPAGIVKSGPDSVVITLNQPVSNPLGKLALNTFFLIPHGSVETSQGRLTDKYPSGSGPFQMSVISPSHIELTSKNHKTLNLLFIPPTKFIRYIDHLQSRHTIIADQIHIPKDHLNIIQKKFKVNSTPEFRLLALKLNPRTEPFTSLRVRQFFSSEFRKTIEEFFGQSDGSLFSKLMPGYISQTELSSQIPAFEKDERLKILETLRKNPPVFSQLKDETIGLESFQYFLRLTLKRLEIREQPTQVSTNLKEVHQSWKKGQLSIGWILSGLPGDDLTDSIQLLMSKNMCYQFGDVKEDPLLKKSTLEFLNQQDEKLKVDKLKEINRYLYKQSVLSVMTNYSYITIAHKNDQLNAQTSWVPYFSTSIND